MVGICYSRAWQGFPPLLNQPISLVSHLTRELNWSLTNDFCLDSRYRAPARYCYVWVAVYERTVRKNL